MNIAYQKQPVGFDRPSLVRQPSVLEYKPLSLQKPQALTSYYRSLLFASASTAPQPTVREVSSALATVDARERRSPGFEEKAQGHIEEHLYSSERITVSNIYPNPASEYAEVDYTLNASVRDAKIIFYNVLGSSVAEYALDRTDRKLRVNTREMPSGIYFYQLAVEGKKVATKKMLVRHQQ
ncbi:hypothetical protein GCM10027275_20340 [Rhabdobacter roseus]|uniref:Secretion system C-terminal sorting domain-containing protein n=1 Tax=Rhabdobacter roseus TaxID=1655419 RepID=A0A840TM16_9BACT|nr:hypothetical protein [Rhabdobacter roseus]